MAKNYRIFFGNIGYARGINGSLLHHLIYAHRHIYCPPYTQKKILSQVNSLIQEHDPDLCCLVEIEKSSFGHSNFNQIDILTSNNYQFFDIENKYGNNSLMHNLSITRGKSNGFISKEKLEYEKFYFNYGTKRLIYKIRLKPNLILFFAHFSLNKKVRKNQLLQIKEILDSTKEEIIFLGDFNILSGLSELNLLLQGSDLRLINDPDLPTFRFHKSSLILDLCLASKNIAPSLDLNIYEQPYSDHAALILDIV